MAHDAMTLHALLINHVLCQLQNCNLFTSDSGRLTGHWQVPWGSGPGQMGWVAADSWMRWEGVADSQAMPRVVGGAGAVVGAEAGRLAEHVEAAVAAGLVDALEAVVEGKVVWVAGHVGAAMLVEAAVAKSVGAARAMAGDEAGGMTEQGEAASLVEAAVAKSEWLVQALGAVMGGKAVRVAARVTAAMPVKAAVAESEWLADAAGAVVGPQSRRGGTAWKSCKAASSSCDQIRVAGGGCRGGGGGGSSGGGSACRSCKAGGSKSR